MSTSRAGNRRYLFQVWLPAIAVCAVVGTALIAALSSGERDRIIPAAGAIAFAVVVAAAIFWYQKNRMARMLQTADPVPFLRSFAASMSRIEHGALYAAAHPSQPRFGIVRTRYGHNCRRAACRARAIAPARPDLGSVGFDDGRETQRRCNRVSGNAGFYRETGAALHAGPRKRRAG